jgi:hypothetical protein
MEYDGIRWKTMENDGKRWNTVNITPLDYYCKTV